MSFRLSSALYWGMYSRREECRKSMAAADFSVADPLYSGELISQGALGWCSEEPQHCPAHQQLLRAK